MPRDVIMFMRRFFEKYFLPLPRRLIYFTSDSPSSVRCDGSDNAVDTIWLFAKA